MPRSLASCYENLVRYLDRIATAYGRQGPAQRQARADPRPAAEQPHGGDLPDGLHEFIDAFIGDNNQLGTAVAAVIL